MARKELIFSFPPPKWLRRMLLAQGYAVAWWQQSGTDMPGSWIEQFHALERRLTWDAQKIILGSIREFSHGPEGQAFSRCLGDVIEPSLTANTLARHMARLYARSLSFVFLCRHARPDARLVLAVPSELRARIAAAMGFEVSWLSAWAWRAAKLGMLLRGLKTHGLEALRHIRDHRNPDVLRLPPGGGEVVVWDGLAASDFTRREESGGGICDFISTGPIEWLRESAVVLVQGKPEWSAAPPVRIVSALSAYRVSERLAKPSALACILRQAKLASALPRCRDADLLMAEEVAKLPRYESFYNSVLPARIILSIDNINLLPLHFGIARTRGAHASLMLHSCQARHTNLERDMEGDAVPINYAIMDFERYYAWTEEHKVMLTEYGVPADRIEICGPILYGRYTGLPAKPAGKVVIDIFDQQPIGRAAQRRIGQPYVATDLEHMRAFIEMSVGTISSVMAGRDVTVRIKSKRFDARNVDQDYKELLTKLVERYSWLEIHTSGNPLLFHSTASLSIAFPYVSPAVSSAHFGVPSCFFDPMGDLHMDPLQCHGVSYVRGQGALSAWLESELDVSADVGCLKDGCDA